MKALLIVGCIIGIPIALVIVAAFLELAMCILCMVTSDEWHMTRGLWQWYAQLTNAPKGGIDQGSFLIPKNATLMQKIIWVMLLPITMPLAFVLSRLLDAQGSIARKLLSRVRPKTVTVDDFIPFFIFLVVAGHCLIHPIETIKDIWFAGKR